MTNQNGDNKVPAECPRCKQRFSAPMPPIEVVNALRTSMVVAVHPNLIHCPNRKCAQAFTYVFAPQYQVVVGMQAVNDDAVAAVEGGVARAGRRVGVPAARLPLPAGDEQVEQGGAPAV